MLPRSLLRVLTLLPLGSSLGCGDSDESPTGATFASEGATTSGGTTSTGGSTGAPTSTSGPTTGTTGTTSNGGETHATTATTAPTTATTSTGTTGGSSSSGSSDTGTTGPLPTCDDQAQNQDETDVDCGGSCSPCLEGQMCLLPGDCVTGTCEAGVCAPMGCQADDECAMLADACNDGVCDPNSKTCAKKPVGIGKPCDDGDLCTKIDACVDGLCVGAAPVDCKNLDSFCGFGVCDPQSGLCGVKSKDGMDGMPCDDGFECTPEDVCGAGICGPGGPGYALFEDFSGAAPGWQVGAAWQIGSAKKSPKGPTGEDPASDHTLTDDNRLAGALIGNLVQGPALAKTCLTSPPVDTTGAKTAWVTFWRQLHTDYFPYAYNQIEVFDGIDWVELEAGYNNPGVDDPSWQQIYFDVADFSNEALRLRICFSHNGNGDPFAGWSVDDVTIGPYVCTP